MICFLILFSTVSLFLSSSSFFFFRFLGGGVAGDPLLLVLQYCEKGSLENYLREHRSGIAELTLIAMLHICAQVAAGMEAINKLRLIHRDLAARNVLLSSDYTCKVPSFFFSFFFR